MVTWTGSNGVGENWLLSGCFEVRVSLCCKVWQALGGCWSTTTGHAVLLAGLDYLIFRQASLTLLVIWHFLITCRTSKAMLPTSYLERDLDGGSNLALTWLSWHCSQVSLESSNRNGRSTRHSVLQHFGKRETGHQEESTSAQNSAMLEFCRLELTVLALGSPSCDPSQAARIFMLPFEWPLVVPLFEGISGI